MCELKFKLVKRRRRRASIQRFFLENTLCHLTIKNSDENSSNPILLRCRHDTTIRETLWLNGFLQKKKHKKF